MAAWAAGRRGGPAFERLVELADRPDLVVNFCPPEVTAPDEESLPDCFRYNAVEEAATLRGLPGVDIASRGTYRGMTVAPSDAPDRTVPASSVFGLDVDGVIGFQGRPLVIEGRSFADDSADEVVVNEFFVERTGLGLGDDVEATFWSQEELGAAVVPGGRLSGPRVHVRIVGVVRGVQDVAARSGAAGFEGDEVSMLGGPAVVAATPDAGGFNAIFVWADGDPDVAAAEIEAAFADRTFNLAPAFGPEDTDPIREAIDYESAGALAFGGLAALSAVAFGGQAIARQSRREWSDLPVLRALGTTTHQSAGAALLRGAATGLAAAVVAVAAAIALSPLGPIGAARAAETDPGTAVDGFVVAVGAVAVALVVTAATAAPVAGAALWRERFRPLGVVPPWVSTWLPASSSVGVTFARGALRRGVTGVSVGSALVTVSLAVGAVAVASVLVASLSALLHAPERFGAPWDVSVGGVVEGGADSAEERFVATSPDVAAAAGIVGTDARIGDQVAWVQAFEPLPGVEQAIEPVVLEGRAPVSADEIALGVVTMRALDLDIGDTVPVRATLSGTDPQPMTVVGTTVVNDTYESSPGRGGIVTPEWIVESGAEATPDPYVVRLAPGVDRAEFTAALRAVSAGQINDPVPQGAIRNVDRIRRVPFALAALVGVLALATIAHALVLLVRRQRVALATLRSLGFVRRQVALSVGWSATVLAVPAALVGVPLGVAVGRAGWRAVADGLGVASDPATSVGWPFVAVLVVLVAATLAGTLPAWWTVRRPAAAALRSE